MFYTTLFALLASFLFTGSAYSKEKILSHVKQAQTNHKMSTVKNSLRLELYPSGLCSPGRTMTVTVRLIKLNDKKSMTLKDFKEVHTQKLHLLVIDSSLSDYHHIHPKVGDKEGEFVFDFTPKKNCDYRVWADVTPLMTNKQEYVMADMGRTSANKSFIDKTLKSISTVGEYTFELKFDEEIRVGRPVMGSILVTKRNKPFTQLEPVMGAFAHVVAFGEDYNSVLHIHPMGKEPTQDSDRGGPILAFHMEPKTVGFVKLFAQMRIDGNDIFVPFGIVVRK